MKQLQILILGFLNNSEFFHLKKKKNQYVYLYVCFRSYNRFLHMNQSYVSCLSSCSWAFHVARFMENLLSKGYQQDFC